MSVAVHSRGRGLDLIGRAYLIPLGEHELLPSRVVSDDLLFT